MGRGERRPSPVTPNGGLGGEPNGATIRELHESPRLGLPLAAGRLALGRSLGGAGGGHVEKRTKHAILTFRSGGFAAPFFAMGLHSGGP